MLLENELFRLNREIQSVRKSEDEAARELEKYRKEHPDEATEYDALLEEFISFDSPTGLDEFLDILVSRNLLEFWDLSEAASGQLPSQNFPEFTKNLIGSIIDACHSN